MKKLSRKEIEEKVNEILVDKLCVTEEEVKPEASLEDNLGADSLDAVEIIMEIEREVDITIPDEEVSVMKSCKVSDVYDIVEKIQNQQH